LNFSVGSAIIATFDAWQKISETIRTFRKVKVF